MVWNLKLLKINDSSLIQTLYDTHTHMHTHQHIKSESKVGSI